MTAGSAVLFDVPGPKGRRRIRIVTIIALLLVALIVVAALLQLNSKGQLASSKWIGFVQGEYLSYLWQGVKGTIWVTFIASLASFPLGLIFAVLRVSKLAPLRWFATTVIEFFRSVPLLLLIYFFLLALPRFGVDLSTFWMLVIPVVLSNMAVNAEVFRAGINAVATGQTEAAKSIGLRSGQSMRIVVLPQAIRLVIPSLIAQLVALLKDSTLGFVVSYNELMHVGQTFSAITALLLQTYVVITVIYVVVNFLLSQLALGVERALRRRGHAAGSRVKASTLT